MININSLNLNKKILLIDDEKDILNLLETVLIKEGFKEIYKAENGNKGIKLCEEIKPDIIVLDIMLPDIDGYEVCKRIREFSMCPIIFLSAKSDDVDKLLGLGIGGDDYVTKPFSPKEIAFRIKAHFRRLEHMQSKVNESLNDDKKEVIKFKDIEVDEKKAEVKKSGAVLNLTAKEYQLLLYLVKNPNIILSKNSLIENIWGSDYEGYDNTLMVHIRHLREKIEDDPSRPKYITTFKGLGYKFIKGD
ncbi:response regulator transcription factor [Turicibacter bilis]|uniref:Stage 0 sporulation protein A homolog n=2 Tax=Peptostreptococcales TaxID=3082720 RepID=A0A140L4A3_9FIRM|nr:MULTISPECIES: response regulator transcription factor [Bacillota]KXZ39194.1 two component transcriptional regulator, winged helix family [[Clostridium] paradoxum JW-YL-7 = DSM 7308]KXG75378.1 Transcriptional regulatory protein WalR [Thermotalea metallivorans]MBS3203829.1 response regulator transcription factor [Turicibacter bilis]MDY4814721.1 response regulator transcription factor [Turicibacter bilis]UUF11244.1 response regulator transcription factor [Turicibacter bilis]